MSDDDKKEKLLNPFRTVFNRMLATFAEYQWASLLRSYFLAMRPERKARLHAIMELSCELAKIKAESIQATAFGEMVIEAIIEGDWKRAAEINGDLTFKDHGERCAYYEKLWENFRAIAIAACAEAAKREKGIEVEPD